MNFQARYDDIINQIENAVFLKVDQIPEKLARDTGVHLRVIADAFQFIAGMTLAQYIKQRRLVHALKYKHQTNCSLEKAAETFGFADSATMSKAFKNYFGVPPSQMSADGLEAIVPLTLDRVLMGESENSMDVTTKTTKKSEMFGVDSEKFQTIKQVLELSAVYGLSDKEAEYAYNLSQRHQVPLSRKCNPQRGTANTAIQNCRIQECKGCRTCNCGRLRPCRPFCRPQTASAWLQTNCA